MAAATRQADERLLLALAMRDEGRTWAQIARALGSTPGSWRVIVHRVQKDLAASEVADR